MENLKLFNALCNSDDLMSSLVNFEISSVWNNESRRIDAYTVNQLNVPDNKKSTFLILKTIAASEEY